MKINKSLFHLPNLKATRPITGFQISTEYQWVSNLLGNILYTHKQQHHKKNILWTRGNQNTAFCSLPVSSLCLGPLDRKQVLKSRNGSSSSASSSLLFCVSLCSKDFEHKNGDSSSLMVVERINLLGRGTAFYFLGLYFQSVDIHSLRRIRVCFLPFFLEKLLGSMRCSKLVLRQLPVQYDSAQFFIPILSQGSTYLCFYCLTG